MTWKPYPGERTKPDGGDIQKSICIRTGYLCRRFFGTRALPEIRLDEETLRQITKENTENGYTVTGVQKKLSLHLFSDEKQPRLTLVNYPNGYILKPQVQEFEALPEAEQLVMCMADAAGIATVPHALIRANEQFALTMNGKKRNLRRKDFLIFASACGIPEKAAEKMIARLLRMKPKFLELCTASFLPEHMKEELCALIEERCSILSPCIRS